jgi:hypothetical protein
MLSPITAFGEKLTADYAVMTAEFSPEELLFLLVNPPEIPYTEGDFIHISVGGARRNTKNLIFSVVNNIVNRMPANAEYALTYKDTVYIDMALRKLGIENIALFMERARTLRDENLSVYRLTEIYRNNIETLRETLTRDVKSARVREEKAREGERGLPGKSASFYMHSEIFKRLDTVNIVNALARFAQGASEIRTRLSEREMLISEQRRTATILALSEYRRELPAFGGEELRYSRNHYETDGVRRAPTDEKAVISRALTASLLQLIDNVTTSRAEYYLSGRNIWIDITDALHMSARNSVERFLAFRSSAFADTPARGDRADIKTLALLAKSETDILSYYIESVRVHGLRTDAEVAAPAEASESFKRIGRGERVKVIWNARDTARRVLLELARVHVARLRAAETQAPREHGSSGVKAEAAPIAERADGSSFFADGEKSGETAREEPVSEETLILRETVVREETAQGAAEPADDATRKARYTTAGTPETAGSEAALTRIIDSGARVRQAAGNETTYYRTERETHEIAQVSDTRPPGAAAGDEQVRAGAARGAAESETFRETVLREALDRINTENKERLEHLKELRTESEKSPIAARPDRRRIMRDALQAIEDPVSAIREISEREESLSRRDAGREEELLLHTDETSRKILESLRLLRDDPAAAAAAGIRIADGPEPLISEIAFVEREQAENARFEAKQFRAAPAGEPGEQSVKHLISAEPAFTEIGSETHNWDRSPPIVHRRPGAAPDIEEILRRREQRVVSEHFERDEETTETSVQTNEIRTENSIIGSRGNALAGSAEDIAEMINSTLMRRIGVITDRVYGQLEKKLKSEKSRRGGL